MVEGSGRELILLFIGVLVVVVVIIAAYFLNKKKSEETRLRSSGPPWKPNEKIEGNGGK